MWKDADRYEDGEDDYDATPDLGAARDPNAYWRRRFFILGGGIAVVGLCVWLFPGGHHAAPRTSATARASMAALDRRRQLPAAAYGSPWPSPSPKKTATATPRATKTPDRAPTARPRPAPIRTPARARARRRRRRPAAAKGPRCAPSDIVLSLFTGQPSYGQGASPKFDVYAVSTSAAACTLSYGPGSVQVVVTRHGRVVWDSAACKPPAAAAGAVHPRRAAGALDRPGTARPSGPRGARARCRPAPRARSTRSR